MRALLILAATVSYGAVLEVCNSGCAYSSVQTAINAAVSGDVIELRAGQTFVENVLAAGAKANVRMRSSRWQELPPADTRIDPVLHAHLLAKIQTSNGGEAFRVGHDENVVAQNGVDVAANTMQFETALGLADGIAVACFNPLGWSMPAALDKRTKYWLRDWNAGTRTGRLALTSGGAAIDISTVGDASSANYYGRPRCTAWDNPSDWWIEGIHFEATSNAFYLVSIGKNVQPNPLMGPNRIRFHQVVVSSPRSNTAGAQFGLVFLAGSGHAIRNSYVAGIKSAPASVGESGNESKAIWLQNVDDVHIENNFIESASINILTAGGDSARVTYYDDQTRGVVRNVRIKGNLIAKGGYLMYKEGSGVPTGECYYGEGSGAFYRRTSPSPNTCANGACYTCQPDKTWALDTTATYLRGNYLTKNLIELKDCDGCIVEGNMFRGGYVGPDAGQGACASITAATGSGFGAGYHINYNVFFRNNWCDQVYGGLSAGNGVIDGPGFNQLPMRNINIENNLVTNLGRFPALSQWPNLSDVSVRNFSTGQAIDGLTFARNTFRPAAGMTSKNAVTFGPGYWPAANYIAGLVLENNVLNYNGPAAQCAFCISFPPAESGNCVSTGFLKWLPPSPSLNRFRNNVVAGGTYGPFDDFVQNSSCTALGATANVFDLAVDIGFASSTEHRLSTGSYLVAGVGGSLPGARWTKIKAGPGEADQLRPMSADRAVLASRSGNTVTLSFRQEQGESACSVSFTDDEDDMDNQANLISSASDSHVLSRRTLTVNGATIYWRVVCGSRWAAGSL